MDIPFELVSMAMVLCDYIDDLPYIDEEHERLVDFANFLRKNDDPDVVEELINAGYDPSDLIEKYDQDYMISIVSGAMAIEEYIAQGGDINEVYDDYLSDLGYKKDDPRKGLSDLLLANTEVEGNTIQSYTEIDLGDFNTVTYNSVEELYDAIVYDNQDLYCPELGEYMFNYNWVGAVCFYSLSENEFYDLIEEAHEVGEDYIGGLLGFGGGIVDVNLKAPDGEIIDYEDPRFEEFYTDAHPEYVLDYTDVYEALSEFVGKEMIRANVADFKFED